MKNGQVTITKVSVIDVPDSNDVIDYSNPDNCEFISLEEAGLEESANDSAFDCVGLYRHADWFYDGSSSEYEQ